jgi:signal recognition particle subunit SRP54
MDLGQGIRKALARITGAALVDEKAVRAFSKDLQRVLITNDVEVRLVSSLCKRIEERILNEKLPAGTSVREHAVRVVYEELCNLMGGEAYAPTVRKKTILLLGLFGSGKTTTIAKLARLYQSKGLKVGAVAGDVHRPAAIDQLEQVCKQVNAGFFSERGHKDAARIASDGVAALSGHYDVIIIDTAGRSAFDSELAGELKKIDAVVKADEKFLVISADIGQVAARQARQFDEAVGLSGVIVTKMDGSGKGGGALSAVAASKAARIAFIASGEKPDAFEAFDARKFVARLCGFPDLDALLSKAKEMSAEESLQRAMEEGKLDYGTFLAQMKAMRKMGPLKQIMQMVGAYDLPEDLLGKSEEKMRSFESAINSMTPSERKDPKLLKVRSRQERVARGAGLALDEVREMTENFDRVQKMIKGMRGNRGLLKGISKMMPGAGMK